ncbi:uncharacterized protein LAESUDRAFT_717661 [Laetiporus sulphureus 93-53]|uniref:Uncharacterized protein n=1 Tax=Laetiporus sulphureus 93-53 TaxID=1314785 RepID=A0A165BIT9_9APHY|nr:uncharacterized protein LAESUDRAFT_717661 [Laetiporus sulphureus 93-53]KZT01138.1 hypothetical protein LAESUDRAFT_717661 [Laetiporus sulphureus 93-53]
MAVTLSARSDLLEEWRHIMSRFLDVSPYHQLSTLQRDPDLEHRVKEATRGWDFEESIRKHIVTGLIIVMTSYRHITDIDIRVAIVLFAALNIYVDAEPGVLGHWNLSPLCEASR